MTHRIHCQTETTPVRLACNTRAKCQEFVATYTDDGLPFTLDSPVCSATTVGQSKSLETREIGRRFAPLWKVLAGELQDIFLEQDAEGNFVVPALDVRAQILSISITIEEMELEKLVFRLAPLGHEQRFNVIVPGWCEPQNRVSTTISQTSRGNHPLELLFLEQANGILASFSWTST